MPNDLTFTIDRRRALSTLAAASAGALWTGLAPADLRAACCYFAAKDKDVNQPAQKAFLTWDPERMRESFTVQPKFEGNASDFGMVIPTPSQPKLDEMPRDFFRILAVFTILEPMPLDKYKRVLPLARSVAAGAAVDKSIARRVVVLEEGVVGSLDYKIIRAEDARDLYLWLDEHQYHYAGDEATLDFYIQKKWFFTVMKIDPKQMKRRPDGSYEGNVTPTRFTFASQQCVYPLRITSLSVKENTEALFYVQAPRKMDLPDAFSYQFTWQPMWAQAMSFAIKLTADETTWLEYLKPYLAPLTQRAQQLAKDGVQPATLEWAKKISRRDLEVLDGTAPYNRDAPAEDVKQLKILRGHVQEGQTITKFRKVFHTREMKVDLVLTPAQVADTPDNTAYYQILPTSPP